MKTIVCILLAATLPIGACEILVKARDYTHPDAGMDRIGAYKRGMPVLIQPDGTQWGSEETLPRFVIIKIPMVPASKVAKYIEQQFEGDGTTIYRRRLWQIRWADLPAAARNKLQTNGELIIKATAAYTGTYDYTWAQIKTYFRNLATGLDETEDL